MPFWSFKNAAAPEEDVELRIEGEIVSDDDAWIYEWFDIPTASPNAFRSALSEQKGKNITVWVDSWGGDVFAGAGIYNALKEHKGKVTVKVDGKAVSAASVIAMAGDEILMSPASILMIHNPWSFAMGEAKDMRHQADVLDEVKETILNVYRERTGLSRNKLSRMMDDETWMSARKAMADGFADGMLYANAQTDDGEGEAAQNAFSVGRRSIMNSTENVMKRFFEQWQKLQAGDGAHAAAKNKDIPQQRVIDIARRVSVREKQFGRHTK